MVGLDDSGVKGGTRIVGSGIGDGGEIVCSDIGAVAMSSSSAVLKRGKGTSSPVDGVFVVSCCIDLLSFVQMT